MFVKYNKCLVNNLSNYCRQYCNNATNKYDIIVVGGGIVGSASAREMLTRHPHLKIALVEKEHKIAYHQSGHNSGVIHAGIYYKPGSLKAKLCVEGLKLSYKYLDEKKIPYKKCGKLIVATNPVEVSRLVVLYERGLQNNVPDMRLVDADGIKEIEPYCHGLQAIHSPHTGIVDWALVTEHYVDDFIKEGGKLYLNFKVDKFLESSDPSYPVTVVSKNHRIQGRYILTCGGLQSDILSQKTGCSDLPKVVPFRGEYLLLNPEKAHWIKGNIYPVPDPRFPFLGVHFTPRMDGSVWLGPNAVLAFKREGYKWTDIHLGELIDAMKFPGFLRLASKFVGAGLTETAKSAFPYLQVRELRKFIPELTRNDVKKGPAGVRAQALDINGELVDDFVFDQGTGKDAISQNVLHCRNAPSPGATSSLAIAKMIADKMDSHFIKKGIKID